ncbi:MAG: SAM-dependent methyltransferase [bacterium]|nr:SAM-dependent methyltransferase [bacterium]
MKDFAFIGRTFTEYCEIFKLSKNLLNNNSFLDCPSGASSFTAESNKNNIVATACDCEYSKPFFEIEKKCQNEFKKIKPALSNAEKIFDWTFYQNIENVLTYRKKAYQGYLLDYNKYPDRYIKGILPHLNFQNEQFDIVLSGHFLFLYADRLSLPFHLMTILELLRVAKKEIRIYPLIGLDGKKYKDINKLLNKIKILGFFPLIKKTNFQFLKNSNELLIIKKY